MALAADRNARFCFEGFRVSRDSPHLPVEARRSQARFSLRTSDFNSLLVHRTR
jgi:hypothetical protein